MFFKKLTLTLTLNTEVLRRKCDWYILMVILGKQMINESKSTNDLGRLQSPFTSLIVF